MHDSINVEKSDSHGQFLEHVYLPQFLLMIETVISTNIC